LETEEKGGGARIKQMANTMSTGVCRPVLGEREKGARKKKRTSWDLGREGGLGGPAGRW